MIPLYDNIIVTESMSVLNYPVNLFISQRRAGACTDPNHVRYVCRDGMEPTTAAGRRGCVCVGGGGGRGTQSLE